MTQPDADDDFQVLDRGQTYRIFGAHLVDEGMTIVAFGPWSGEYGRQFDFLNEIAREADRRHFRIDAPMIGIPAEMPPVERPDLFWLCLVAVRKEQVPFWLVKRVLRRMRLMCMMRKEDGGEEEAGLWARVLLGRLIFAATSCTRLESRAAHSKRCLQTTLGILDNACAVGKEFQQPTKGKES